MTNEIPHPLHPEFEVYDPADRIIVATPCYGGMMCSEFAIGYHSAHSALSARYRKEDGPGWEYQTVIAKALFLKNESHIDRARNNCANLFMASPYNWLLFWDADVQATEHDVARLWMHGMKGAKVVGGVYALKSIVPQFAVNAAAGASVDDDGKVEVINSGTGFKLIHRSVFKALEDAGRAEEFELGANHPDRHTLKTHIAYFKSGVRKMDDGRKLWLSEDYMFDYEWRKIGGKVYIDKGIFLRHHGSQAFPIYPAEAFAAAKEFRRVSHPDCPTELV